MNSVQQSVRNLDLCYQCFKCASGCPVASLMDFYPNQLVHLLKVGLTERALNSKSIWVCVSCETCATRCPNRVDITGMMDLLRQESIKQTGVKKGGDARNNIRFHETFLGEVKRKGCINEFGFLVKYKLKTINLSSLKAAPGELKLGLTMLRKGKLRLTSKKLGNGKPSKIVSNYL